MSSNGIGKNPLNDISRIYLQQVAEKKDDSYLEPDMKKRQKNNEKARKDMEKMGTSMKNPHFEEKQHGWDSGIVNSLADAYKGMQEERYGASAQQAGFQKIKDKESGGPGVGKVRSDDEIKKEKGGPAFLDRLAKAKAKMNKEELELDENRRAARAAGGYKDDSKKQTDPSKAGFTGVGNMSIDQIRKMSARMDKEKKESYDPMDDPDFDHDEAEKNRGVSGKNNPKGGKALSKKKKMKEGLDPVGKEDGDVNNDGKKDKTDKYLMNRRKAIGKAIKGKMMKKESVQQVTEGDGDPCWDSHKQVGMKKKGGKMVPNCVPKIKTESFSAWRNDLSEIMTDDIDSKPIKEKKVVNKIKINPKLGEAIEDIGGSIVEMVEVDEAVYGGEPTASKDTRMTVTAADKKGNTPAYQKYKAGHKGYKSADHMKEGIRDTDPEKGTAERKARLEKKRGMKMDDHPQYKKEEVENVEEIYKGKHGQTEKQYQDSRSDAGKMVSGDSKMSGSKYAQGRRTGSDAGPQPAGGSKKPQSQGKMDSGSRTDLTFRKAALKKKANEEVEVDEAMRPGERQRKVAAKMHNPYTSSKTRTVAHNVAVRGDVSTGDPAIKSRGGGGVKKDKGMGYGDRGAGNKARRRAGDEPMRGNRDPRNEEFAVEDASMTTQELQLQKKKARIDRMIAQKRQQDLSKKKSGDNQPAKVMGEGMGCTHTHKGKECPVHGNEECPALTKEEASDAMKDRRMERGGVAGNVDYRRPPTQPNLAGKKKPAGGMSALEKVKANIRAKHGKGAIMDTKKK